MNPLLISPKVTIILNPKVILTAFVIDLGSVLVFPGANLILILMGLFVLDLITGLIKSKVNDVTIKSKRGRETIGKLLQYGFAIVLAIIFSDIHSYMGISENIMNLIVKGIYCLMILWETISICENMIEMNPKSKLAQFILKPIIKLLNIKTEELQNRFNPNKDTPTQ